MNYQETLKFIKKIFKHRKDKGGNPYIEHLVAVANKMESETEKIVALLHDIVEDIDEITITTLKSMGYSEEIISAVDSITKRKGEKYIEYLKRVKQNPIATKVKLADLEHNMDLSRLKKITSKDKKRLEKYKFAKNFLKNG